MHDFDFHDNELVYVMCTHIINALYCVLGCCYFTKDVTLILFLCMQHLVTNVFKTVTVTDRLAV